MVKDHGVDTDSGILILMCTVIFMALLYDFWSTLIMTILSFMANLLIRMIIYEESIGATIAIFFINSLQVIFILLICHIVISKCG